MRRIKYLTCVLMVMLGLLTGPDRVNSQQLGPLQEMMQDEVLSYMLEISGTVMGIPFEDVKALMTISVAPGGSFNPYVVNLYGFPRINERYNFVWYSNDSYMTYLQSMITCRVKYTYMRIPGDIYFFYPSPSLYERTPAGAGPTQEEEVARLADIVLLPTKVTAQDGKLDIRINGSRVSGEVWIKGYDEIEEAYVDYAASFTGRTVYGLETQHFIMEPHPMHILEQTDERYR